MSLPLENLDNKTFEELVEEAKKRIPIYAPDWTDHNLHDPGITLIEFFAWLIEMQIYHLNRVDANYRNFLKLVGIPLPDDPKDTDALQAAILKAREDMKKVHRAVNPEDFEVLALKMNDVKVARAKALPRYHPNQHQEVPRAVTVVVVRDTDEEAADSYFLKAVYNHLNSCILLTTRLFVILPLYISAGVKATVIIKPGYIKEKVEDSVEQALDGFLDHLTGGPGGSGWPFGRPVYVSEIYEVIDKVEGVDHVDTDSVRLKKDEESWPKQESDIWPKQESDIFIPRHGLVKPGNHLITAVEEQLSMTNDQ